MSYLKPLPSFFSAWLRQGEQLCFEKLLSMMSLLLFAAWAGSFPVMVWCFIPDTVDALIAKRKQAGQTLQITLGLTEELGSRLCSYLLQIDSFVWPWSPGMWLTLDVLRIWNLAVISDLGRNKASRRANKFFPVGVYRSRFINLARVNSLLLCS